MALEADGFSAASPDPADAPPAAYHPSSSPCCRKGWLALILDDRDERETLRTGRRYMSNITIVDGSVDLASIPRDVLRGRLAHFQNEGTFTGRYGGPTRRSLEETFQDNLARMFATPDTPRLSGVQIKAPMCLQDERRSGSGDERAFHPYLEAGRHERFR